MKPYEAASSRAAALYCLATAPKPGRTLQLCCGRAPLALLTSAGSAICYLDDAPCRRHSAAHYADYRKDLPFTANSFERIVLHRTLDDIEQSARAQATPFDSRAFLAKLTQLLTPGGLIAGCVNNRTSPKHAWHRFRGRWSHNAQALPAARLTPHGCYRLLRAAALGEVRVFSLLPNSDSPLRLVDLDPGVSKFCFRYELSARRELSLPAYALRRVAVELGLYPYLEESIFFWGYKPC